MLSKKFPDAYDVEELVNLRSTSSSAIKAFAAEKGVLIAGRGKDPYAQVLKRLIFAREDYLNLHYYAQGGFEAPSISGFNIRIWATPSKTVEQVYQDIMSLRDRLFQITLLGGKRLANTRIGLPQVVDGNITAKYFYERVVPGKIELLSRSEEEVDFSIIPHGQDTWMVLCLPRHNQDVQRLQDLLGKVDDKSYDLYSISLDDFPVPQRIEFYDRLLEYYTSVSHEWRLRHVCGIFVKQAEQGVNDIFEIDSERSLSEVMDENENGRHPAASDLRSITQAALEGKNLRTNSFVKDCERAGFYFSSMTLELDAIGAPDVIRVQVRFKLSPKMFEVVLEYTGAKSEMGEDEVQFGPEKERKILREFWNSSHVIWHQLRDQIPGIAGENRQLVMNLTRT